MVDATILIPCVRRSRFLNDVTMPAIKKHTPESVKVVICHEPDLNVSECRQKWMNIAETRYVYFMDVDSVIEEDGWIERLLDIMQERQAGSVTAAEHWGGKTMRGDSDFKKTGFIDEGCCAGAGMLYDRNVGAYWDPYLGETYGYIGRELEDTDFGFNIMSKGFRCIVTDTVAFNHAWHDKSDWDTDEYRLWPIVSALIKMKWEGKPELRERFFRLLHPVETKLFEKNHVVADGRSFDELVVAVFGDLASYWGLDIDGMCVGREPLKPTTPEERGVEDIWSSRYREVKPRTPK